jgi:hypothetical protein
MPPIFYVLIAGESKGPYLLEQIRSMWDLGVLTADTLYWNEKSSEWQGLRELLNSGGQQARADVPEAVSPAETETQPARADYRLMARAIDLQVFGFAGSFIAEAAVSGFHLSFSTFYSPLTFTAAVTGESLWLLCFRGSTPGKWLFGLYVDAEPGRRSEAFTRRTWSVYWRCAPIFAPFCAHYAFRDIRDSGSTKWDKATGSTVLRRKVEFGRYALGVLIFIGVAVAYTIGALWFMSTLSTAR